MRRTVRCLRECCGRVAPPQRGEVRPTELVPVVRAARVQTNGGTSELDRRLRLIQVGCFARSPGISIGLEGAKTQHAGCDADESGTKDKPGGNAPPRGGNSARSDGRRGSESDPWHPINADRPNRNEGMRP